MATSIGTAWIQIKPTTSSLKTAVESGLNGGHIGASFWSKFSATGVGAIAGIASKLTEKITGIVSSAFSGGMERADVLTRFPKVMEMMGYSASEANDVINKLREGVKALPTPLSDVVSYTQRLAGTAGGLKNASDWILAVSDAMLASGADSEAASRATEQFVQALQRGKPIGNDWLTVMEVAAPTMNALAKELGYAGAEMGGDFYTAWQKGTLATEDLMKALVKLDKEGGNSIDSLNKVARAATGGFKTSITVMGQTVENMISAVLRGDNNLESYVDDLTTTFNGLAPKLINAFVKVSLALASAIPEIIPPIIDALADSTPQFIEVISQILIKLSENLPKLINVIIDNLPAIVETLSAALANLFGSEAFMKAFAIIGGLVVGHKGLLLVANIGKKFLAGKFAKIFGEGIDVSLGKITTNIFGSLGKSIKNLIEPLAKTLKTVLKSVGEGIAGFFRAFANPEILIGAGIFAVAALAVAAAILAIGKAIEWAAPGLRVLMDDVIMPIANFLGDTVLALIDSITTAIIRLTNDAIIPLGEFIVNSFLNYINIISDATIRITNDAIIPLMNTLSGAFTQVLNTIANLITGTLYIALEGLRGIIDSIGNGFLKMGEAVKTALTGVQSVLRAFANIINSIAESLVAIVALATRQSVTYGRGFAYVTRAATGGYVDGIGTATSDSNLYALSKGEYVIKAAAARKIGYENLDAMNETGEINNNHTPINIVINGYNKSPEELANIVSRKIALKTQGVY